MRADEMPAFKDLLTDAMAYYGKDCSAFTLTVWWGLCRAASWNRWHTALQRHAMDPERGQFAPRWPTWCGCCRAPAPTGPRAGLGQVHEAMRRGRHRDVAGV
jgi:hypothetical protein